METPLARFDILGLGCAAVDDLLYVTAYPAADSKVRVRRRERHAGGLTATALVAAARLGARCAYAGILGNDDLSAFVRRRLEREGIGLDHVCRREEGRPYHSIVIVDESSKTRTIFFERPDATGAADDWPPEEVVRAAGVLFVDDVGVAGMLRAARIAVTAGIPVVADFDAMPGDALFLELAALVDHLIVSLECARESTLREQPADAARALGSEGRRAVVVTCGAEGSWYLGEGHPAPMHQPACPVNVVNSTGCGDVFHGAYAAALVRGMDLPARVRFASATAALKATRPGGQAGIPSFEEVQAFLAATPQAA